MSDDEQEMLISRVQPGRIVSEWPSVGTQAIHEDEISHNVYLGAIFEKRRADGAKLSKRRSFFGMIGIILLCASLLVLDCVITYRRGYLIFEIESARVSIESDDLYDGQMELSFRAQGQSFLHSVTVNDKSSSICSIFYADEKMAMLTFDSAGASSSINLGSRLHRKSQLQQKAYMRLRETNFELARSYYNGRDKRDGEFRVTCSVLSTVHLLHLVPMENTLMWTVREHRGKGLRRDQGGSRA